MDASSAQSLTGSWSVDIALNDTFLDYLGHVTASRYLQLFETAHWQWLSEIKRQAEPAFVVADIQIKFIRELLLAEGPVTIRVRPRWVTKSSIYLVEDLRSSTGTLHANAETILVNWDRRARRSTRFSDVEQARIQAQVTGP